MTLSEAIRIGAAKRPTQAFGVIFDRDLDATCALGAAADALGILDEHVPNGGYAGQAPDEWKSLVKRVTECPCCGFLYQQMDSCIIHLNSGSFWTRERIADWVETLEKAV